MWNLITHFLAFTGGMSAGVVLMHFAGRKADGQKIWTIVYEDGVYIAFDFLCHFNLLCWSVKHLCFHGTKHHATKQCARRLRENGASPHCRNADWHDRGCVLFYKVDQNSDFETMERVVRCFSELGVKATQAFLFCLRLKGPDKAVDIIEQGLRI